jgi:hypothetical protein
MKRGTEPAGLGADPFPDLGERAIGERTYMEGRCRADDGGVVSGWG